ncbi:disease resistance protein RFL [Spatholobus suberectus]|nr:disease resistance protein RFL [Spatholobus suberectus]
MAGEYVLEIAGDYNGRRANPILDEIMTALTEPNIMILGVCGSRRNASKRDVVEQITSRVCRDGMLM